MKNIVPVCLLIALLATTSCKKNSGNKTTCTSTVYGLNTVISPHLLDTAITYHFGVINEASGSTSASGVVRSVAVSDQGAFSTADNSYYFPSGSSVLYKVSTGGSVTALTYSGSTYTFVSNIVYDRFNNKLYGFPLDNSLPSAPALPQEIVISGSTFSFAGAVPVITAGDSLYTLSATCDDNTGAIYFAQSTGTSGVFNIGKFMPGSAAAATIATGSGYIMGLRFNTTDNKLYAITYAPSGPPYCYIRIDPATGSVSALSTLSFAINVDYFSGAIDPCSNQYLLTTLVDTAHCSYSRLNMSGALVQHDTVAGVFQGITVNY